MSGHAFFAVKAITLFIILSLVPSASGDSVVEVFEGTGAGSKQWTLKELNSELPFGLDGIQLSRAGISRLFAAVL